MDSSTEPSGKRRPLSSDDPSQIAPNAKRPKLAEESEEHDMEIDRNSNHPNSIQNNISSSTTAQSESNPLAEQMGGYFAALNQEVIMETNQTTETKKSAGPNLFKDVSTNASTAEELMEERRKCQHQMCVPTGWKGDKWDDSTPPPAKPAKVYPFALDAFQKVSIACLERNESVLVSAHTSAGKTVVAQYAIAMSLRDKQRVVYTSPIKALSNQKYRDLAEEFVDVGLMTGDITINPEASCLVMTTEILRSMLYRGSEILREVGWVIFDEIHYMRDKERGVVWEETLILLPDKIRFVFLSATIPNAKEFADWIAHLHNQPCHVVYTDFRPVPLQHYVYPAGSTSLYLVLNERGQFLEDKFAEAVSLLSTPTDGVSADRRKKNVQKMTKDTMHIVQVIMERNYEPVIVFAFSKRMCENLAMGVSSNYNNMEEAQMVQTIFDSAIDSLSDEDKLLPQVISILPMLKRGVGIHHGGLLPLLKEVIELLFQEGLIKCLFATETFSIGLNMPAKTVVFTSVRKWDGEFRWLTGGEYIQMSGRAGRRGLDDRGVVVLMMDESMPNDIAKSMIKGSADTLNSSFHIGYNMLLNTMRVEGLEPEKMLRSSFHQFQFVQHIPRIQLEILHLTEKADSISIVPEMETKMADLVAMLNQLNSCKLQLQQTIVIPEYIIPFMVPGRVVHIFDNESKVDWGWGIVLNYNVRSSSDSSNRNDQSNSKSSKSNSKPNAQDPSRYILDVMLFCNPLKQGEKKSDSIPTPSPHSNPKGQPMIIPVLLPLVSEISKVKLNLPKNLKRDENKTLAWKSLMETFKSFPGGNLPLLHPIEDMEIHTELFATLYQKTAEIEERLNKTDIYQKYLQKDEMVMSSYSSYMSKYEIMEKVKDLKRAIRTFEQVILKDDLKSKKRVLRRLGYTSKDNIIDVKGRVACEINAADELVITELIFAGFFNNLTFPQIASILSCFVFQEKTETVKLNEEIDGPYKVLAETARRVAEVELECKKQVDVDEYVDSFRTGLCEVVYHWAKGASFKSIMELTSVFEGSIIRAMRRLEELLRQLVSAAKSIGNTELENKFAETILCIKRDIVFAGSLYL